MNPIIRHAQKGGSTTLTIFLILFLALVAAGTWAVYNYGDGHVVINDRTLDELQVWEVMLGVVIGIIGAIIGILAGLVGVIIGLVAAILSVGLALAGVAVGMFVVAGVLAGPILLLAGIIILISRGNRKKESASDSPVIDSTAEAVEA